MIYPLVVNYKIAWLIHNLADQKRLSSALGRNRRLGVLGTIRKDLSGDADPIERSGEACIHRHLLNRFHDFLSRRADIEGSMDMHRELGLGRAEGSTHGDGGEFFGLIIESGAIDYVSVGELDNEATQIGGDVLEAFDDGCP
jgi:hypothetical protein